MKTFAPLSDRRCSASVSRLIELPSCEALEVRPPGGGEALLVPMVRAAIRSVAPQRRLVEVDASFLGLEES